MASGFRGRPRCVADIEFSSAAELFYRDRFFEACDSLSYSDCVALSRAFNMSLRAVYAWRRRRNFPRHIGTALTVVDWVSAGKPIKLVGQRSIMTSLL
jgi:hypothetical protein